MVFQSLNQDRMRTPVGFPNNTVGIADKAAAQSLFATIRFVACYAFAKHQRVFIKAITGSRNA
jgi:hypothetical protein